MITTKRQMAEQVIRRLSGGDVSDDAQYDLREIIRLIEQTVSLLVRTNFIDGLRIGMTSIGPQYISVFRDVEVQCDAQLDKAYIDIPCAYIELPDDRGVYHISPMKEQDNAFVPVRNGSESLFSHSPAQTLEGRVGYWVEQNRAYFTQHLYRDGCSRVLVKLVVASPQMVGDDDPYPIGSDMELPVIQRVLELMGVNGEYDLANDNSSET